MDQILETCSFVLISVRLSAYEILFETVPTIQGIIDDTISAISHFCLPASLTVGCHHPCRVYLTRIKEAEQSPPLRFPAGAPIMLRNEVQ